jgi:hypothetical protein
VADHGEISDAVDTFKRQYANDRHIGRSIRTVPKTAKVEYVTAALDEMDADYLDLFGRQWQPLREDILQKQKAAEGTIEEGHIVQQLAHFRPLVAV